MVILVSCSTYKSLKVTTPSYQQVKAEQIEKSGLSREVNTQSKPWLETQRDKHSIREQKLTSDTASGASVG